MKFKHSILIGGIASLLCLIIAAQGYWLRLNISRSLPLGLYLLTPLPPHLKRGMLVTLYAPASVHPWHSWWLPLLKPVAGLPGDTACVLNDALWLFPQGDAATPETTPVPYGPLFQSETATPVPHITGCLLVAASQVFLASPVQRSLDSRYFGVVAVYDLRAQAHPLFTW